MEKQLKFQFFQLAIGERINIEWQINARYVTETVPVFDYEGDPAGEDLFESVIIDRVAEWTLGFDSGEINKRDIPVETLKDIVNVGLKHGRNERNKQQKKYEFQES